MSALRMGMSNTGKGGGKGYIPQSVPEIPREDFSKLKREKPKK